MNFPADCNTSDALHERSVKRELIRKNVISDIALRAPQYLVGITSMSHLLTSAGIGEKVDTTLRYAADKDAVADKAKTSVPSGETSYPIREHFVQANWILN